MEQSYLDETSQNRDAANRQLERADHDIHRLSEVRSTLRELVRAYDTILSEASKAERMTLPSAPALPPVGGDDDANHRNNGEKPPLAAQPAEARQSAPERHPEFQRMTLPEALDSLLERPEMQGVLTVDRLVDAIYVITNARERATARRTLNGELSRAVQRDLLVRVGRGQYLWLGEGSDPGHEMQTK